MDSATAAGLPELIRVLHARGLQVTLNDLRDIVWLAACIGEAAPAPAATARADAASPSPAPPAAPPAPAPSPPPDTREIAGTPDADEEQSAMYGVAGVGDEARAARRVQLRGAPALPRGLAIARALKPLSRRRPGHQRELDERASAERIADTKLPMLVWTPLRERWFDILMVVEDVPTLSAWQPVVEALEKLLERQGGFRSVSRLMLRDDGGAVHARAPDGRLVAPAALREREGRRIVIVLSDCTSDAWRRGAMGAWLQRAASRTAVAVAPLLPQSMWPHTAIGFAEFRTASPRLAAPSAALSVRRPGWAEGEPGLVLPVLALEPAPVAAWARMVAAVSEAWCSAALLPLPDVDADAPDGAVPSPPSSPDARAEAFRAGASPEAHRLAAYFSVVRPLTPPVMRVIQQAMLPAEGSAALAQVFLGGLLVRNQAAATPDEAVYDFHPGLRDRLQGGLTRQEFVQVNLALHEYLQQLAGTPFDFFALLEDHDGTERLPEAALPFVQTARAAAARHGLVRAPAAAPLPRATPRRLEEVTEIEITAQPGRFTFVYRIATRGTLTIRHKVKGDFAQRVTRALEAKKSRLIEELAEDLLPPAALEELDNYGGPKRAELVLDETTAKVPWELLFRSSERRWPVAVRCGLTRRPISILPPVQPRREWATVIGKISLLSYPPSHRVGSPNEALRVSVMLRQVLHPARVAVLVSEGDNEIQKELLQMARLRVLHIATHVIDDADPAGPAGTEVDRIRFVLGGRLLLTIRELLSRCDGVLPELIYLSASRSAAAAPLLMANGAQVVVAYAGPIDDQAAQFFAEVFYQGLADGQSLLETTQHARALVYEPYDDAYAWGRFQVWGDPGWRLVDDADTASESRPTGAAVVETEDAHDGTDSPAYRPLPRLAECQHIAYICSATADNKFRWITHFAHELDRSLRRRLGPRTRAVFDATDEFPTDLLHDEAIAASFAFVLVVGDALKDSKWALREVTEFRKLYGDSMARRLYVVAISRPAVEALMAAPAWREIVGSDLLLRAFYDPSSPDYPLWIGGDQDVGFWEQLERLSHDIVSMTQSTVP